MSQFPGATWTSSHVYGQGTINAALGVCYFNIPKCASMWMRKCISQMEHWWGCNFVTDDLGSSIPLIILRDPVQRWISNGPAREQIPKIYKDVQALDKIFDDLESWLHDEHSARQTDFIAGLDQTNAIYFYCDQDLSCNVEHFFRSRGVEFTAPALINEQTKDSATEQATKIWQELLSRPKYYNKFQETFAADYKLIESVKFYKHDNYTR